MLGDRTGKLLVGFNQSYYSVESSLPNDMDIYRGGMTTMRGKVAVEGVFLRVEGVLKDAGQIVISDGGNEIIILCQV